MTNKDRVLVVGGTSGMGLAAVVALVHAGFEVVLTGRTTEKAEAKAAETGASLGLALDFTDDQSVSKAFQTLGRLDHLVLVGSGGPARGPLTSLTPQRMAQAWDEKFLGFFRCLRAALPTLAAHGSVTVVTGGAARSSLPGTSGVAAVNAAIQAWALVLAKELAPRRVNVLSPGIVDTPLHDWMEPEVRAQTLGRLGSGLPVGRVGTAGEIGAAVAFLVTNGFVSGAVLDVDGGGRGLTP